MGQTLTHGIYLPDEGERNCYNGLASNWQLLDGAVGTVAEHTTALAGKAPAVHTHTKADITDFPALANVATSGSYNDLSNIPASFTPASHTHGNLTNDGKVGTTANLPLITGTDGVVQAGSFGTSANTFCEGNDSRLSDARTPVAHTHTKSDVTDLLNSNFIPSANNSYDLGSSSNQWNNLYASKIRQIDSFSSYADVYQVLDSSSNRIISFRITKGANKNTLGINVHDQNNSAPKGLVIENDLSNNITITGGGVNNYLGTSTNKWKTLNGVNPGALSLPDMSSGTGVSLSVGSNSYSPPSSGWLSINLTGAISVVCGNFCHSGTDMLSVPVVKGSTYTVTVATSGTAYLFVSQGNV